MKKSKHSQLPILEDMLTNNEQRHGREPNPVLAVVYILLLSLLSGFLAAGFAAPFVGGISSAANVSGEYFESLPKELPEPQLPQRSVITDVNGRVIAEFYSENRVLVELENISQHAIDALIATEDADFFSHKGVDISGIGRALLNNLRGGNMQGGSTITQQLVKNTLLINATNEQERQAATANTLQRKLEEASLAIALESKYSKEEILESYFNISLFSNAVYGIGTASRYYFNVDAKDLTVPQAATLIGILKNPTRNDPIDNPENSIQRRNVVLYRMMATEKITPEEYEQYIAEPLGVSLNITRNGCAHSIYPFYCSHVLEELLLDPRMGETIEERERNIYLGGLTIRTNIDPEIQDSVQDTVVNALGLDNRVAAGVAIVEPGSGKILAMAQNRLWGQGETPQGEKMTEINLVSKTNAQTGSAFKVFTLVAALENGFPANGLINAPAVFNPGDMNVPTGGIKNLSRSGTGVLSINQATAISSNTYFAELQRRVGVLEVLRYANLLGLGIPEGAVGPQDASFTLGTTNASVLAMAGAYATFAADGVYCTPYSILEISHIDRGELTGENISSCHQAISVSTAQTVREALIEVVQTGTGETANIEGYPIGIKTGTTSNHAALWVGGITPNYATAIWMGDPRGGFAYPLTGGIRFNGVTHYRVYASDIVAPFYRMIMTPIVQRYPDAQFTQSSSRTVTVNSQDIPTVTGMTVLSAKTLFNLNQIPLVEPTEESFGLTVIGIEEEGGVYRFITE